MQSSLYESYKTIENNQNTLSVFNNQEFGEIRTLNIDNEPWFVGKDVATALGYSNTRKALIDHIDSEDKGVTKCDTLKGKQDMTVINESGLYSLILSSKLPNAKKFKRWVTSEVLPQIRRTGGYIPISQEDDEKTIMAKALMISQRTIEEKDVLLAQKEKQVQYLSYEVESKDKYLNQIAQSKNTILVRELAKVISKENFIIGERRLWDKLRAWGLILKGKTEPSQRAVERGLFEVSESISRGSRGTFTHRTTRVTGKGQDYIIKRLLEEMEEQICI
ncbi:MAG: phage antirepressor [Terrisporobacter othiniensis]|uniref:phage antirepressor n=1 Tax=Terrisporobacter othiniensis TaxID=1577792 RepID=UPI002A74ADAD|nr:phage antirepressor [Terrisporobacter othiniensis]MDY3372326.1 phage antirepressor [Terrisporobacter othiniensis]